MLQHGTETWLAACRQAAEAWSAAGAAQADIARDMARIWAEGAPKAFCLPDPRMVLRDELIFARSEAARFAEAAHETLRALEPEPADGAGAVDPPPLPE
jgi:hypothetical protein